MAEDRAPRRLLMLTNAELGLSNVFLAAVHELMRLDPDLEIHLASFDGLARPFAQAVDYAAATAPRAARRPVFHELRGSTLTHTVLGSGADTSCLSYRLGANPFRIAALGRCASHSLQAWEARDFVDLYRQVHAVCGAVQPHLVVVDPLFTPGLTLCVRERLRYVIYQPNSIKELSLAAQPWGQALWKYPALASGLPFPVPWHCVPQNIYYSLVFAAALVTDPRYRRVAREVERELGFQPASLRGVLFGPPDAPMLLGCRPELDFPLAVVPGCITPCGPIVRPAPPVGEADPALARWLSRGRVVYVNMGTLKAYAEDEAREMATALRRLLDADADADRGAARPDQSPLRVLWKLKKSGDYSTAEGSAVHAILKPVMDHDRVRIVDWLRPEPSAILDSGCVVCSVNHGGASSWYEALCAGVPQVILPVWFDTYEAPRRAEFLGVGCFGNPHSAPRCVAAEVGPALIKVVLGPRAAQMRARAQEVAAICRRGGDGRTVAAREMLKRISTEDPAPVRRPSAREWSVKES